MTLTWLFLFILEISSIGIVFTENQRFSQTRPIRKIKVSLSERRPFVVLGQNGKAKGLDVIIIENFAAKYNLQLEYFHLNLSLNFVFANKDNFKALPMDTLLGYVLSI